MELISGEREKKIGYKHNIPTNTTTDHFTPCYAVSYYNYKSYATHSFRMGIAHEFRGEVSEHGQSGDVSPIILLPVILHLIIIKIGGK